MLGRLPRTIDAAIPRSLRMTTEQAKPLRDDGIASNESGDPTYWIVQISPAAPAPNAPNSIAMIPPAIRVVAFPG